MSPEDEQLLSTMIGWLDSHGFIVIPKPKNEPNLWRTFDEFAKEMDVAAQTLSNKLRHENCPPFVKHPINGQRIRRLIPTKALQQFVKQYGNDPIPTIIQTHEG